MLLNKITSLRFIVRLLIVILMFSLSSCSFNRVYGLKKTDFLGKVSRKDYQFIFDVDYLKNSIKEINRLGDGASYYMSFVYKNNDMLLFSNKLLYQEIQNKHPFYGPKAANQLLKQLLQEKDYIKTEVHAMDFFDIYKGDYPGITKQLIEAIYWQKKDSVVIPYIDNLDRSLYSDYANNELDMIKAISSARLNLPDWEEQYKSLFFNQPLSPLLSRAYSFIYVYPDYGAGFTKSEIEYFKAISLASSGDYRNSQEILRNLMFNEDWIFSTSQSIKNISRILKESRVISINLNAFEYAMDNAPKNQINDALVSYASLYFNIENFSSVVNILEDNIDNIDLGKTKDDALWLYLLSLSHVGRDRVLSKMAYYIPKLSGEEYSSDIIDHVITALVQNKEWSSIKELEDIVKKYGSITDKSRISWIVSRLYFYDYIDSSNKQKDIERELDSIILMDTYSYYSYMANALLKRESNLILSEYENSLELNIEDKWIQNFLLYGLEDEAIDFSIQVKELNYDTALNVSKILSDENKHLEALRFMSRTDIPLNKDSFLLYYPLPYKEKIINVSESYGIPPALYSGLIRTESGFDMDVVSSAGAVGLSQLMPATAIEQANDMGMKNPDLNNPDTNILLGGAYIDWLIDRFDRLPISFMAYNAGPGNVWDWQRRWGDLPDELFIEAAPFKETRNYVPKILKSAIYYGNQEFNISPYEVVKQIFPNID